MKYRVGVAVGLIATILYFDLTKEYYHQIMGYLDVISFWKIPETVGLVAVQQALYRSRFLTWTPFGSHTAVRRTFSKLQDGSSL